MFANTINMNVKMLNEKISRLFRGYLGVVVADIAKAIKKYKKRSQEGVIKTLSDAYNCLTPYKKYTVVGTRQPTGHKYIMVE